MYKHNPVITHNPESQLIMQTNVQSMINSMNWF